ncbi:MAG: ABC transporter permease [Candidatus Woesebacteria bacterium]|jgi:putative ABC transport system permease protein
MLEFEETINLAVKSIWRNRVRSGLTALGIIIGVAAVILLVSLGQGLQNYITGQFEQLGTNLIFVLPGTVQFGQGPPNFSGSKLTMRHVEDLKNLGPPIKNAAVDSDIPGVVKYKGESKVTTVGGVSAEWSQIINIDVAEGRMLSESDVQLQRNVAVLGQSIAEEFFGSSNPIGKRITIENEKFQIIGLIEEIGAQSIGFDIDNFIAIPITVSQRIFGNEDSVQSIIIQASRKEDLDEAIEITESYFLSQMDEEDFSVVDQSNLLETINNILGVITAALGGIAAISLVVGGVGIMNIMLVSVTERTREIGLRKALGAKRNDILLQFIIEAVTLSVLGGAIGILIGWGGSLALNRFFPAAVTAWAVTLSFGVSAAVGIIFGVAPAIRASQLDPIDALRYE